MGIMNSFFKTALSVCLIGAAASTLGSAVAEAKPATSIDSQDGAGGKVDRDGTQGAYDRDGTYGEILEATQGDVRSGTQGEETGPDMVATPGWTSKPPKGF